MKPNGDLYDRWPQRWRFKELLDEWLAKDPSRTIDQFAELVHRSVQTVYSYRTRPEAKPPFELVQAFCREFGEDESELWSFPNTTLGKWADGLTDTEAHLLEMAVKKFKDPALSTEDREMLFEDWLRDYDRIKAMKARHSQT